MMDRDHEYHMNAVVAGTSGTDKLFVVEGDGRVSQTL